MTYQYNLLAPSLHATADAAIAYFRSNWGIPKASIKVESAFHPDIGWRPTFVAATNEHHILCVEVAETVYNNAFDSVVLRCRNMGLPVRFFVAVPKGSTDTEYERKLRDAKSAGVGVLIVDSNSGDMLHNALSLSLAGVRPVLPKSFPPKYREVLHAAEDTFRNGQPAKACLMIYEELEACSRRLAQKAETKKYWPNSKKLNIGNCPWARLIGDLNSNLNRKKPETKLITSTLLSRIHGVTTHRNETGHKPASQKQLIKRDTELRTRFEHSVDLLRDFIAAAKAMGV